MYDQRGYIFGLTLYLRIATIIEESIGIINDNKKGDLIPE